MYSLVLITGTFMSKILFNTHDVILLITSFLFLFFIINIFLTKQVVMQSKLLLAAFLFANAIIPLDILINYGAGVHPLAINEFPNWFYVFEAGYWVQGPLLLWYMRSLVYKNYSLSWSDLLYLLPFMIFELHQLVFYHSLASEFKASLQIKYSFLTESITIFFITLTREGLRVFFGIMCLVELNNYKKSMRNKFSTFNEADFTWINILVWGSLILWVMALFIASIIIITIKFNFIFDVGYVGLAANYLTCLMFASTLISLSCRSAVFEDIEKLGLITVKSVKNPINQSHVERLEELIAVKKPYMDSSLTLESLATMLAVSPRTLSTLINGHYQSNFYEFINKYRINEAKAMLASEKYRSSSVLDIMYEVGFNSKATFNNFFKKNEGITPSEYKKKFLLEMEAETGIEAQAS